MHLFLSADQVYISHAITTTQDANNIQHQQTKSTGQQELAGGLLEVYETHVGER